MKSLLVLIFAFFSLAFCFKGIPKDVLGEYKKSDEKFTCLDGKKSIPISAINDDYCDCQDGSDEPGTAACPNGKFWCENSGARGHLVPSSRVGDSICDCCDGSDENNHQLGNFPCKNTCKEIAEAANKEIYRKIEQQKRGMQTAAISAAQYHKKLQDLEREILEILEKKAKVRQTVQEFEKNVQDTEALLAQQKGAIELKNEDQINKELDAWVAAKQLELDTLSTEEETDTTVVPEGEQKDSSADAVVEEEEEEVEEITEQARNEQRQKIIDEYCDRDDTYKSLKEQKVNFEAKLKQSKDEESQLDHRTNDIDDFRNKDVGPDARYSYMIDSKYEIQKDQYTYSIEPFGLSRQGHTSVGNFKEFTNNYSVMMFDKGQNCWGGPDRSLEVRLVCGESTHVLDVREESKCTYLATMETPGACNQEDLRKLEASIYS